MIVFELSDVILGEVVKRPSSKCQSPYVADVILDDDTTIIAHAPSLGCCGYVNAKQKVVMVNHPNPKLCTHVIHLAHRIENSVEYFIGVHPKSAEKIVNVCLEHGLIETLNNVCNIQREQTYLNSRFDFTCIDENNRQTIIEVKNVPCANYEDNEEKIIKKKDFSNREYDSKVAYFPDGYRKKKADTVSPRALKHIIDLGLLKKDNPNYRCILIFVIQRPDVEYFQGSVCDPIYKEALNNAHMNGVEIIPIQVIWDKTGKCTYNKVLPFVY
jgi:DNA-binding sugar fermentation-stimulating protein